MAQDYAFGRDGVKAFKEALAKAYLKAKIIHEEYAPAATTDFTAPVGAHFRGAQGQGRAQGACDHLGRSRIQWWKIMGMDPERYGIEIAHGWQHLPVMKVLEELCRRRGRDLLLLWFPQEQDERLAGEGARKTLWPAAGFLYRGRIRAAMAVVDAIKKAGGTDTEKLIAAMEGMSFETPKGTMTFRKEDHQAMQNMYHFRIKQLKDQKNEWDLLELVREIPASRCRSRSRTSVKAGRCRAGLTRAGSERTQAPLIPRSLRHRISSMSESHSGEHPVLETHGLTIRFGGHVAVNHVSCAFRPDTLTAIVGPNGAGKTTYFNLISGQLRPTGGRVTLSARTSPPSGAAAHAGAASGGRSSSPTCSRNSRARKRAPGGAVARRHGAESFSVFWHHVELIERAEHYLHRVKLAERRGTLASALAHGDQRKLEVAILLALDPDLFMFDEPTAGMSVDEVPVILELIHESRARATRPYCWSSTKWTWSGRWPTASSCCIRASSSPTASRPR